MCASIAERCRFDHITSPLARGGEVGVLLASLGARPLRQSMARVGAGIGVGVVSAARVHVHPSRIWILETPKGVRVTGPAVFVRRLYGDFLAKDW